MLISLLALLVLQVRENLSPRVRITLVDGWSSTTGGAVGTAINQTSCDVIPLVDFSQIEKCTYAAHPHYFTWYNTQEELAWSDVLSMESSCTHIATFVGLLCVLQVYAMLQAGGELETRGQSFTGACFQVHILQIWISCQAREGSIFSLTSNISRHL